MFTLYFERNDLVGNPEISKLYLIGDKIESECRYALYNINEVCNIISNDETELLISVDYSTLSDHDYDFINVPSLYIHGDVGYGGSNLIIFNATQFNIEIPTSII